MKTTLLFLALLCGAFAGELVQVPPPDHAPYYDISMKMGVCSALRMDFEESPYRCAACNKMQPPHSWLVWVPVSTMPGDSTESIMEQVRLGHYNSDDSGWCIDCAPKLEKGWEARRAAWLVRKKKWDEDMKSGKILIGTSSVINVGTVLPGQSVVLEAKPEARAK